MPRVSTATEGFYSVVTTNLADGSALYLEVSDYFEVVADTVQLTVAGGSAEIDIAQSVAEAWPTNARFTLVAPIAGRADFRLRMKDPATGGIDHTQRVTVLPSFAEFEGVLDGATHTFTVLNGIDGWRYDLIFNDTDTTPSVLWPNNTITRSGLPTDGQVYPLQIGYWPDGDTSDIQRINSTVTAASVEEPPPIANFSQFIIPNADISEGAYGPAQWAAGLDTLTSKFWEPNGTGITTVSVVDGVRALGVRLDGTDSPSTRLGAGAHITPTTSYRIKQRVYFDPGFDWGGTNEGGKLGFGLAGGAGPSGGLTAQDGFSCRFMWRTGGRLYAYVYDANTTGYGTDIDLGVDAPRGAWFDMEMEVIMNSAGGAADGILRCWINDVLEYESTTREWFGTGTPQIDTLWHFTFHGGNDGTWTPGRVNHVYFSWIYFGAGDEIAGTSITNVRQNTAQTDHVSTRVQFDVSPASGAQLRWRVDGSSGAYTYGFNETTAYASHNYGLTDLLADTTYEVIIESGGATATLTVTTDEAPVVGISDTIPFGGDYIGYPFSGGYGPGNSQGGTDFGKRIRVDRTGYLTATRVDIRSLREVNDVEVRCNQGQQKYCDLIAAGMNGNKIDRMKGAFALGGSSTVVGSYFVGSGGWNTIELWPNDPATNRPDFSGGTPIATTATDAFKPIEWEHNDHPVFEFLSPGYVEQYKFYHIVYKNSKPPKWEYLPASLRGGKSGIALGGLTFAQAAAMPDDYGAFTGNGVDFDRSADGSSLTDLQGPFIDGCNTMWSLDYGVTWQELNYDNKAFWELRYSDGSWIGQTNHLQDARYFSANYTKAYGVRRVEGNTVVRQFFTPKMDGGFPLNGVWVQVGFRHSVSSQSALTIKLKNSSGTTLATATLPFIQALYNKVNSVPSSFGGNDYKEYNAKAWRHVEFNSNPTLSKDSQYHIELSAASGAGWEVTGHTAVHAFKSTDNTLGEAGVGGFAQTSTNGGSTFGDFPKSGTPYPDDRLISFWLTRTDRPIQPASLGI